MHINILFIVMTFVIIIAVVLLADNLTSAMLIVSLLANFFVISGHFNKLSKNILGISATNWGKPPAKPIAEEVVAPVAVPADNQNTNLYGEDYERYHAYQDSYTGCYNEPKPVVGMSCSENSSGIDAMNAIMAQRRARDKKCMDGVASKDVNYYRHHFGSELDEAEAKPWWGAFD
jgi:hypothetical protein